MSQSLARCLSEIKVDIKKTEAYLKNLHLTKEKLEASLASLTNSRLVKKSKKRKIYKSDVE